MTDTFKKNLLDAIRSQAETEAANHHKLGMLDALEVRFYLGVWEYAVELAETLDEYDAETLAGVTNGADLWQLLHNGAADWAQYSAGGCSLIYTDGIWERLGARSDEDRAELCQACDDGLQNWPLSWYGGAASRAFRTAKYGRRCSDDLAVQAAAIAIAAQLVKWMFESFENIY